MLLLSKFKISGHSMSPKFKNNDKVLVSGIFYFFKKPKINEIIAFKYKSNILIKRVSKLENNKYFVSGDNKTDSLDSRKIGLINKKDIIGKVFYQI